MAALMRVEIPYGSKVKYEVKDDDKLYVDRILHTPIPYPFNYGYIPETLAEDGDAIDAILLGDTILDPRCYIEVRIIGALEMSDEKGRDVKLVCVPLPKVDPRYAELLDINDINSHVREQIRFFFEHYKKLEKNKSVNIGCFYGKQKAWEIYLESKSKYK